MCTDALPDRWMYKPTPIYPLLNSVYGDIITFLKPIVFVNFVYEAIYSYHIATKG